MGQGTVWRSCRQLRRGTHPPAHTPLRWPLGNTCKLQRWCAGSCRTLRNLGGALTQAQRRMGSDGRGRARGRAAAPTPAVRPSEGFRHPSTRPQNSCWIRHDGEAPARKGGQVAWRPLPSGRERKSSPAESSLPETTSKHQNYIIGPSNAGSCPRSWCPALNLPRALVGVPLANSHHSNMIVP